MLTIDELQARVAELLNHADSMRIMLAFHKKAADDYRRKWAEAVNKAAELEAQPAQVQGWQMPKPMAVDGMYGKDHMYSEGWNDALLEVARLNAAAPQPSDDVAQLRKQLDEARELVKRLTDYSPPRPKDTATATAWLTANPA